jgi:hypothetical protein
MAEDNGWRLVQHSDSWRKVRIHLFFIVIKIRMTTKFIVYKTGSILTKERQLLLGPVPKQIIMNYIK